MTTRMLGKRKRDEKPHPYLVGNFAPIHKTCPLTPCQHTGNIPTDLAGGQYVRNGSNPVSNEDLGREAHWFDGDGMLSGVSFAQDEDSDEVRPEFVNQYILTDIFLSTVTTPSLQKPILPSIATLVNPLSSILRASFFVCRAILLVILSRLPGSQQTIKKISVANTAIMYHDGRALATCESGPPLRIQLPGLDTVGWFDGNKAEGEPQLDQDVKSEPFGGKGLLSFMKEWTTAHPKVDPISKEMVMFHSTFAPPFVHYSVLPATHSEAGDSSLSKLMNKPVAGVSSAKMMHDFGVSHEHTIIMDLPLTLDPLQLVKNRPPINYDLTKPSRFGVFPRHQPSNVKWFETVACCIFHTVNSWDVYDEAGQLLSVDMLACRMTSASVVFNAGNIAAPQPTDRTVREVVSSMPEKIPQHVRYARGPQMESPEMRQTGSHESTPLLSNVDDPLNRPYEDDQCRLYYYSFSMEPSENAITHQYALSAIPFEFPSTRTDREMQKARYIYGCTTVHGTFNSALGRNAKVDGLVKFDTKQLLKRAHKAPPRSITGCVDERSALDIVSSPYDNEDPIQIFQVPENIYAQEPRFVPAKSGASEDEGYLLSYMFDERQLGSEMVPPPASAFSELWIIDAKSMKDVIAKVQLPQRVPYGLHGNWFSEEQVRNQRPIDRLRTLPRENRTESNVEIWTRKMASGLITAIGG